MISSAHILRPSFLRGRCATVTATAARLQRLLVAFTPAAALMLLPPETASAANKTWSGANAGRTTNWSGGGGANSAGNNWAPTGAPIAGDSLFFGGSAGTSNTNTITANTIFSGITFNSGASSFTLGGNAVRLSGTGTSVTGTNGVVLLNNSSNLQTVNLNIALGIATGTIAATSGNFSLGGVISGTNVTFTGTNQTTLSGTNTFTGVLDVRGGTVRATTTASALGAGTLALNGGNVDLANNTGLSFSRNTTVAASGTIFSERLTAGAGVTHTLGTLSIGGQSLTVATDATVTSGTAGLTFGAVTLTANNASFVSGGTNTLLTLGAISGAGNSFSVGGPGRTTIAGAITTGVGGLTKTGAGSLALEGANTYSGATTISGGTVTASSIVVVAGASNLGNASSAVVLGDAVNPGTLSYTGTTATYTRGFTLGAGGGRFEVTTGGATVSMTTGEIGGSGLFTIAGDGNVNASSVISTTGGLTKTGTGTLGLSGANTFGGVLTGSAGVIRATTTGSALGGGSLTLAGAGLELANDSGLAFGRNTTLATSGSIVSDRLTAGAGVTYSLGALTIGGQTLTVARGANVTSGTAGLTFSGATLTAAPTLSVGTGVELAFTGAMSGTFGITKTGAGTLTLSDASSHGDTTVSEGRLNVNFISALGTSPGTLSMANGTTLGNTSGDAVTVGNAKAIALGSSLSFVGPSNLNLGPGTATLSATNTTIDVAAGSLTFGGNVVGAGRGITKTGTGVLVFTHLAAGAYTGDTTISAGEVFLDGASVLGGGSPTVITIQDGAFLRIGSSASLGNATINTWTGGLITGTVTNANVVFTTSGTLTSSDSFINGTQTIAPSVTVTATANFLGNIPQTPVADRIVLQNASTLRILNSFDIEANQGIQLASGTATFQVNGTGSQRLFVESVVSGSGTLRKTGQNNLRLLGANTFTGGTIIEQGIIGIVSDASLGAASGGVRILGGELVGAQTASGSTTDVTIATARAVTIGNGTTSTISAQTGNRLAYAGTIGEVDGGGAAGSLRIGFAGAREGLVVLGGANTYRGSTTIAGGTLEVAVLADGGAASGLGQSSNAAANLVIEGGGRLRFGGSNGSTDRRFTIGTGGGGLDSGTGTLAFTSAEIASLAGTGARTFTLGGSGTGRLATILADQNPANPTSLTKTGAGTWELTSAQQFTGLTSIDGGRLLVNASLTSAVAAAESTTLGGTGSIAGALSGAGLVSPGNSPGILTAGSFDGSTGLDAAFEFTAFAPNYAVSGTGALNDVLRLTDASPFGGFPLGSGNVIDVYFNVGSLQLDDVFQGGFFTAQTPEELLAAVQDANFQFWVRSQGTGERTFEGVNYDPLSSLSGFTTAQVRTRQITTDFGGGTVTGSVTEFVVVPEPGSVLLAGVGLVALACRSRLRRRPQEPDETSRHATAHGAVGS